MATKEETPRRLATIVLLFASNKHGLSGDLELQAQMANLTKYTELGWEIVLPCYNQETPSATVILVHNYETDAEDVPYPKHHRLFYCKP